MATIVTAAALALERILRRDRVRHLEARGADRLLEILGTHDAGDIVDRGGFGRLVGDGTDHT